MYFLALSVDWFWAGNVQWQRYESDFVVFAHWKQLPDVPGNSTNESGESEQKQ